MSLVAIGVVVMLAVGLVAGQLARDRRASKTPLATRPRDTGRSPATTASPPSRPAGASDLGERVVNRLYQLSRIDAEWSVREARGFTWWAGPLAQRVWADPPTQQLDHVLTRVHARTDFISGFLDTDQHRRAVDLFAGHATLSGLIRDPQDASKIQLATAVSLHQGSEDSLGQLLALAAAIQVAEAHIMIRGLPMIPEWSPASSAHPTSGARANLDDMLNVIAGMVAPLGVGSSKWAGPEMEEAVRLLQRPPCVLVNGGKTGLAAEFPFPAKPGTSLLQLGTAEPHPRLGSGCLCRLTLPHGTADAAGVGLALRLNALDCAQHDYYFGSWCASDNGVTYVSFLPNAAHRPGLLINIVMSLVNRAVWVTRDVFNYDVHEHFASTQRAVMARAEALLQAIGAGAHGLRLPKKWYAE